jgi:hypothetical protein
MNGNAYLLQQIPRLIRQDMRTRFKSDMPSGYYYLDHRHQPVATAVYGAVQAAFTLGTVNTGNTHLDACWESTYSLSVAGMLPGIQS